MAVGVLGVLGVLSLVTLRQEAAAGADAGSLLTVGEWLVAVHDWTFLLGPGLVVGIGLFSRPLAPERVEGSFPERRFPAHRLLTK